MGAALSGEAEPQKQSSNNMLNQCLGSSLELSSTCKSVGMPAICETGGGQSVEVKKAGSLRMTLQGTALDDILPDGVLSLDQELLKASMTNNHVAVKVCIRKGANTEARLPLRLRSGAAAEKRPQSRRGPGTREKVNSEAKIWDDDTAEEGLTPLMYAAKNASIKCIKALLHARAQVNAEDEDAVTPLHFAAMAGSLDAVRLLIQAKADCGRQDSNGVGILDYINEGDKPEEATALRDYIAFEHEKTPFRGFQPINLQANPVYLLLDEETTREVTIKPQELNREVTIKPQELTGCKPGSIVVDV